MKGSFNSVSPDSVYYDVGRRQKTLIPQPTGPGQEPAASELYSTWTNSVIRAVISKQHYQADNASDYIPTLYRYLAYVQSYSVNTIYILKIDPDLIEAIASFYRQKYYKMKSHVPIHSFKKKNMIVSYQ